MLKVKDEDVSKSHKYNYHITQAKIPGPDPKNSVPCYRDTCSFILIAALFTIARKWYQPRFPSTEKKCTMKRIHLPTEFCSALRKNEVMKFAGKRMELENIILSKVTLFQEDKCCSTYMDHGFELLDSYV